MHPQQQRKPQAPTNHVRIPRDRDIGRWGEVKPIRLKSLLHKYNIAAADMAEQIKNKKGDSLARATIYQAQNRGILPLTNTPNFKLQVEAFLHANEIPEHEISTCWQQATDADVIPLHQLPIDQKKRIRPGMAKAVGKTISDLITEATMLTPSANKHFKLFKSPFLSDVHQESDVYMSSSHRYAMAAMNDAARNGGFVAMTGECGGGKSVLRRMLVEQLLNAEEVRVIQPQTIDKSALNSGHILDAIIDDLAPGTHIKRNREAKSRQVRDMLIHSSNAGQRHVLIIEEAHDLSVPTMKILKRLWEIERGMSKVLGIVLIGQPELRNMLNIRAHFEMREVILRCLITNLEPLDADLEAYVAFKLKRIGKEVSEILADGWADAVRQRLTNRDGYSALYPLHIHNLIARSMNMAAEYGEEHVSADIIKAA